ncbi:MAG: hypothetical protein PHT07_12890 [Paludibacter sp.]|nr:hypothetical protein [Paludibacter sp.]
MTVIANIDVSTPTGRKIVRELEKHKRVVQITYPDVETIPEGSITLEEGIEELWNHLENRFGYDLRKQETL